MIVFGHTIDIFMFTVGTNLLSNIGKLHRKETSRNRPKIIGAFNNNFITDYKYRKCLLKNVCVPTFIAPSHAVGIHYCK